MTDRLKQMFDQALAPYEQRRRQAAAATPKAPLPMVVTVWQPWAWAIVCGTKRVENRSRPTAYRGRLLIHVGHGPRQGWEDYVAETLASFPRGCPRPSPAELREQLGYVIGEVTLVGSKANGESPADPWAVPGQCGWLLERPRVYTRPFALRGQQGLFRLPAEHFADLQRAGIKLWHCNDLDVTTDNPHQAVIAYSLAGADRFDTLVTVNRQRVFFGDLLAEAARWSGEEQLAQRFERETQRRVRDRAAGVCLEEWPSRCERPQGRGEGIGS
jgi:hypothetical protein